MPEDDPLDEARERLHEVLKKELSLKFETFTICTKYLDHILTGGTSEVRLNGFLKRSE